MKASFGIALAMAGTCLAVRAEAQTVVVGPRANSIAAQPNAVVTVPIVADLTGSGGASLGSVSGQVTWRTATLRFAGASEGTAGSVVFNAADTASGILRFALANPAGVSGVGALLNVSLRVIGTPGDTASIGVTVGEASAAQTFADLLAAVVETPAQFCTAGGRYGDIDGNDSLRSNDALYIVTNAVGLPIAPYTVVNGDVDADGRVDTRDALVVLTHVVGLPTPGFRVGQLNTYGCGIRPAASVALQAPASVVVGDVVPLIATARDSTNAITNAAFQWLSRDTTVVRTGPGNAQAVGTGTTWVVVIVGPGVMDSTAVTVSGARRVWYVDQVLAASNTLENGSAQYPFSALQPALEHAAADDTIRVAPASYGAGARIVRPVVILGDSTAAGVPVFGGSLMVDSIPAGTVHVERVLIADAAEGVQVHGAGTGRLELVGVRVERSRRTAIRAHRLEELSLRRVGVDGAGGAGIDADSTPIVRLADVRVDAVSGSVTGELEGVGLGVRHADSLLADSVSFRLGTVRLMAIGKVLLRRAAVTEAEGPVITGDSLGAVTIDTANVGNSGGPDDAPAVQLRFLPTGSLVLHEFNLGMLGRQGLLVEGGTSATLRGVTLDGPGISSVDLNAMRYVAQFRGAGDVSIAQSWIGYGYVSVERACVACAPTTLRVDTTTFVKAPVASYAMDAVLVRGSEFSDGPTALLFADTAAVVSISNSVIRGAWPAPVMYTAAPSSAARSAAAMVGMPPFALVMGLVDSVRIDSTHIHDNAQGAVALAMARTASYYGNTIENNHTAPIVYYPPAAPPSGPSLVPLPSGPSSRTLDFYYVQNARLAQNTFVERDGMSQTAEVSFDPAASSSFVADSNTIQRALMGFYAHAFDGGTSAVVLRGNRFEQTGLPTPVGQLAFLYGVTTAGVYENSVDTSAANAPQFFADVRHLTARGNSFTGVGRAFNVQHVGDGDSLIVAQNLVRCGPTIGYVDAPPSTLVQPAAQEVSYDPAVYLLGSNSAKIRVDSNSVAGCRTGISVAATYTAVQASVRRNLVVPHAVDGFAGIVLQGQLINSVVEVNEVGPGTTLGGAIRIDGGYSYGPDSTVLTENSVHDVRGLGVVVMGAVTRTVLDRDTIRAVGDAYADYTPCSGASAALCLNLGGGTRTRVRGLVLQQNRAVGIRVENVADTLRIDSTVVVDDSAAAIRVHANNGGYLVGAWNFVARNGAGIVGEPPSFVSMAQSVLQLNPGGTSGYPGWDLRNNYWGSAAGPRCGFPGCNSDTSSTIDQVMGVDSAGIFPFLTSPPLTPVGAPPAPSRTAARTDAFARLAPGATRSVRADPFVSRRPAERAVRSEEVRP